MRQGFYFSVDACLFWTKTDSLTTHEPKTITPENRSAQRQHANSCQTELLERRLSAWRPCRYALAAALGCVAIVLSAAHVAHGQTYTVLHAFNGTDGLQPMGSVILSGSTLYATTSQGRTYGDGTIFSIGTDGGGFQSVLSFSGGTGGDPRG